MRHWPRRALVEHHHNVGAKRKLDVDGRCRREFVGIAVQVGLKGYAFFRDQAKIGKREDLETAGISQDSVRPGHELVETAELADELVTRAEKEVVSVSQDDGGLEVVVKIALGEAFYSRLSANGHENRRGDVSMFGMQDTGAGAGIRAGGLEFEGDLAGQVLV
jgi:hypothetical protein